MTVRPRVPSKASSGKFPMVGNHRCLDFVNTELIEQGRRVDRLQNFADLVGWLEQAQVLSMAQAKQVLYRWGQTSKGAGALSEARAFRRVLREMAEGIVHGKRPSAFVLDKINALLRYRTVDVELLRTRHGFERRASFQPRDPIHLLVPVAESSKLAGAVKSKHSVVTIGRVGWRKTDAQDPSNPKKPLPPFRMLIRDGTTNQERWKLAEVIATRDRQLEAQDAAR